MQEDDESSGKPLKVEQTTMIDLVAELKRKELSSTKYTNVSRSVAAIQATTKDRIDYDDYVPKNTFTKIVANTGKFMKKTPQKQHEHFPPEEDAKDDTKLNKKDQSKTDDAAEIAQKLIESRRKLEEKSKIYDQLQEGVISDHPDDVTGEYQYLVDFDTVTAGNVEKKLELKKISLAKAAQFAEHQYFEQRKRKWLENKSKNKLVEHYQDVIEDELREHGTGYFQFSTDEKEREAQLDLLNQLRRNTVYEREKTDQTLQSRRHAINKRLDAIKKRRNLIQLSPSQSVVTSPNETKAKPCGLNSSEKSCPEDLIDEFIRQQKHHPPPK